MNKKRRYIIIVFVLALVYVLFVLSPLGEYEICFLALAWFPAHWLVYKIVKVE